MATVLIQDVNTILVEQFRELAQKQGVKISVLQESYNNKKNHHHKKSLHNALLSIPKLDSDNDIFARDHQEHREIDW